MPSSFRKEKASEHFPLVFIISPSQLSNCLLGTIRLHRKFPGIAEEDEFAAGNDRADGSIYKSGGGA